MKKQSKLFQRVGFLGFVLVFIHSLFTFLILAAPPVQAATTGTWIDGIKVKIVHDGDEIIMTDANPYDNTYEWLGGARSRGDCRHKLVVDNYPDAGSSGTFTFATLEADGRCERADSSVNLTNSSVRRINAYRLSQDDLWLYLHFDRSLPALVGCGGSKYDRIREGGKDGNGTFSRRPASQRDSGQQDEYLQRNDAGDSNELTDKIYVETANDPPKLKITWIVEPSLGRECTNDYDVFLSESPPPDIYGFDSGDVPPVGGGGDGGTGDTAVDECEDKASEEGGWGWVICPMLEYIDNTANDMLSKITDLLTLSKTDFEGKGDSEGNLQVAWSYFRNIASFALIIIGLVMVIGQATSGE